MNTLKKISSLFILALIGCNSATDTGNQSIPLEASVNKDGFIYTLTLSKITFELADTLKGSFKVTNQSGNSKRFDFANVQQLGFKLYDSEGKVSIFYPFVVSPALSSLELQNGDSKVYELLSRFKNHNGDFVNRSQYKFSVFLLDNNSPEVSLIISIK